jgi:ABC-type transport system involved in multi-copper enzyme maturation permease subunit
VIQYSSFIEMYRFVTTIEFLLLMFIVPAITAASISSERERQTLELMLTTQMTSFQVVTGKLLGALSTLALLILSGMPAVAMVFVYGGITWTDAFALLVCYGTVAFFAGSVGLCFSALFKRSTISTVVTYGVLIAVVAGTYFANQFSLSLSAMNINRLRAAYELGESVAQPTAGGIFYLFLINPAVTFFAILSGQTGRKSPMFEVCSRFGMGTSGFLMEHWIPVSILIQLAIGAAALAAAVYFVEPVKKKHKKRR